MPRLRSKQLQSAPSRGGKASKAASKEGSAAERAYRAIREEIILRRAPGSELDETELLQRLGFSRTPVREALARLAGERLVQLLPNKGARVAPVGWVEIREHIESLDVIQRLVTRLAASRRSNEDIQTIRREQAAFETAAAKKDGVELTEANLRFHTAISASCRNSVFDRFYTQILTEGLRIDRHAMFRDSFGSAEDRDRHIDRIVQDHAAMVKAIADGDPEAAEQAAKAHSDLARKRISDALTGSLLETEMIRLEANGERGKHNV